MAQSISKVSPKYRVYYRGNSDSDMNEKVFEIREIGKVNLKFFEKGFGKLKTDDIIVTGERLQHIRTRHPNDYDLFEKYGKISVTEPDYVIKDCKNAGTVFMVKK